MELIQAAVGFSLNISSKIEFDPVKSLNILSDILSNEYSNSEFHDKLSSVLRDVEGINEEDSSHPLLPIVDIFALIVELFTSYYVEVSALYANNEGVIFFQIDEVSNKFFFAFYQDYKVEFSFPGEDFYNPHKLSLKEFFNYLKEPHQENKDLFAACNLYSQIVQSSKIFNI